ncbi:hypothetical protein [Galbibacter pacificus]|uniref:Lipocalin-like domain-containing protein n=1 Tax=Galbibacter pacificus TaxID=2996052 RepID=A0ABT6FQC0_9FLAO|nr:hypothetical protein [Galbibacter pacificus]MDG3582062.1 hypothetical protein [Galbibacter pacificus]MDG3585464.1 hypothetical protein [Galbibacter pacificus]
MKKALSLIAVIMLLVACSKDEINDFYYLPEGKQPEKEVVNIDTIVGIWKNESGDLQIFSNQFQYTKVKINQDYHFKGGTWEKIEKGVYLVQWKDDEGSHTLTIEVEFSDNGNTMDYSYGGETYKAIRDK